MKSKSTLTCTWCRGKGFQILVSYGRLQCLNCKGTGKGSDGGKHT